MAIDNIDKSQKGLLIAGIWFIGEFADLLLKDYTYTPNMKTTGSKGDIFPAQQNPVTFEALKPSAIVDVVEHTTQRPAASIQDSSLNQIILTSYAKLMELASTEPTSALSDRLTHILQEHLTFYSLK